MPTIIGIELSERDKQAVQLQEILTQYGCQIHSRIGIHHGTEEACTNTGIILLDTTGEVDELILALENNWKVHTIEY